MNEFSNQAKDPRACDDYRALQKENETLRVEVERLRAREQVMREALEDCERCLRLSPPRHHGERTDIGDAIKKAQAALAHDAGSALLTREQIAQLLPATYFAHLPVEARVQNLVEHWRSLVEVNLQLEKERETMLTHEQVQPLVRALTYCCGANDSRSRATAHKALAHARTLGFK